MTTSTLRSALAWALPTLFVCALHTAEGTVHQDRLEPELQETAEETAMQIHYLEIVTPDLDATCEALEKLHGVGFGEPVAELGGARTAALKGGGRIGVRAPMHDAERAVVRPYVLVDDLEAAVGAAQAAGGELMVPPMEIPGQGRCALYGLGGIEHALWQL